jgi:hypothetical protein
MKKILSLFLMGATFLGTALPAATAPIHFLSLHTIRLKGSNTPEVGSANMYITPSTSNPTQIEFKAHLSSQAHDSIYKFKANHKMTISLTDGGQKLQFGGSYKRQANGKTGCILTLITRFKKIKATGRFTLSATKASGTLTVRGPTNNFIYLEKFTAKKV